MKIKITRVTIVEQDGKRINLHPAKNFEDEKDIPDNLCDVLSDFFPFDVMKALNDNDF